jgi:hypothetical protein
MYYNLSNAKVPVVGGRLSARSLPAASLRFDTQTLSLFETISNIDQRQRLASLYPAGRYSM